MPPSHQIFLRHVICVLHRIALHSHTNNMTARNLSVCVAQNLLWPPRRTGAAEMLGDVSKVSQICQQLIDSAAEVLGPCCLDLFTSDVTSGELTTHSVGILLRVTLSCP